MIPAELQPMVDKAKALERNARLKDRLRTAYGTALRHAHDGGQVQIHVGSETLDDLLELAHVPNDRVIPAPMLYGFPIIPAPEHLGADHLSVHVVHTVS